MCYWLFSFAGVAHTLLDIEAFYNNSNLYYWKSMFTIGIFIGSTYSMTNYPHYSVKERQCVIAHYHLLELLRHYLTSKPERLMNFFVLQELKNMQIVTH